MTMSQLTARRPRGRAALAAVIALAAAAALAVVLASGDSNAGAAAAAQAQPKPNIVVVMTDDQTVQQMSALRQTRALIGRAGTTFTRNYANYPLCCPSRSTFMTGQYAHNHKVLGNKLQEKGGYATFKNHEDNTVPVWLSKAGYATAHIGKFLNGYGRVPVGGERERHVPPGWSHWFGSVDPSTYNYVNVCINQDGKLLRFGDPVYKDPSGKTRKLCPRGKQRKPTYSTNLYMREAAGFIKRRAPSPQPFFLSVAPLAPHGGGPRDKRCGHAAKPATTRDLRSVAHARLPRTRSFNEKHVEDKPPYMRKHKRLTRDYVRDDLTDNFRCRRASMLAVDRGVAKLVAALKRAGEFDNTLFVFTSDNGFFQGEHRIPHGKIKPYEPAARVPALVRGPGVPAGRRVESLTANVDLPATIVEAAGATPGRALDGVSLRTVAQNPQGFAGRTVLLENGPKMGGDNPHYVAVVDRTRKLIRTEEGGRVFWELYPMGGKHDEAVNMYKPGAAQDLVEKLERLRTCAGADCHP